jgi:hypothetical protein
VTAQSSTPRGQANMRRRWSATGPPFNMATRSASKGQADETWGPTSGKNVTHILQLPRAAKAA